MFIDTVFESLGAATFHVGHLTGVEGGIEILASAYIEQVNNIIILFCHVQIQAQNSTAVVLGW